LAVRKAGRSKY